MNWRRTVAAACCGELLSSSDQRAARQQGIASLRRKTLAAAALAALLVMTVWGVVWADDCVDTGSCRNAPRNIDAATAIALTGPFVWLGWQILSQGRGPGTRSPNPLKTSADFERAIRQTMRDFEQLELDLRDGVDNTIDDLKNFTDAYNNQWLTAMNALDEYRNTYRLLLPDMEKIWDEISDHKLGRKIADWTDTTLAVVQIGHGAYSLGRAALRASAGEAAAVRSVAGGALREGEVTLAKSPGQIASEMSHEAYGPGRVNHVQEYEKIIADLEKNEVRVNFSESTPLGEGAYGPAPRSGSPGSLSVHPDVDVSTLGHEYDHFLFDQERGYPGMREYLTNPQIRIDAEIRAYNTEIARAQASGRADLANVLEQAKQAAVNDIKMKHGL